MEFLGAVQLCMKTVPSTEMSCNGGPRPEATQVSETPETVLKETAASRQRAFTPPRHWEIKRLLIYGL